MWLISRAILALSLISSPAHSAELRADRYGALFNKAADSVGASIRLSAPNCNERFCSYAGDRGVQAEVDSDGTAKRTVYDSVMKIPISFNEIEVAAILQALILTFVPEVSQAARDVFALGLVKQLANDKIRAEGRLGKWVFVLRHDPKERFRIIVHHPDR